MIKNLTFFFNGQEYTSQNYFTLSDLLNYFDYNSSLFVVEYNHFICPKKTWNDISIQNKDTIELVTIVGGG
jgi:thiamine biosynthesis protein ThiS